MGLKVLLGIRTLIFCKQANLVLCKVANSRFKDNKFIRGS